jgi:CzcA family heavy metal efflux pump
MKKKVDGKQFGAYSEAPSGCCAGEAVRRLAMLQGVLRLSFRFRLLVVVASAVVLIFGFLRLRDAPIDVLPEFAPPTIQIQTEAPGLSAAEVEDLVTLNLEEILTSVSWLQSIHSKSLTGLSSILMVFEPGTDLMAARQLVQERLNLAHALPNVSKPPVMLQPLSVANRAMMVGLTSNSRSLIDLSVLARWTITPKLLSVPGVANVTVWGDRSRQMQVLIDPERLRGSGVTVAQVVETAGDAMWVSPLSFLEASTLGSGGWIDTPNQRLGIQHIQPIASSDALAEVAVEGTSLRLGDVAKVVEGYRPLIGDALLNNNPGLLLVIEKFPSANSEDVVRGLDAALAELRQGLPGIEMDPSLFRHTSYLDAALENLGTALAIGGALLVLTVGVLFFSWRAALISLVVIPLSLVVAGFVLTLLGTTLNVMVLTGFAMALVVIIDDNVATIDNIIRRVRAQRDQDDKPTATLIFEACLETGSPVLYLTLVLVLATVPLFLLPGTTSALFSPLALSFAAGLLVSMVVGVMVTPALAYLLLRGAPSQLHEPAFVELLHKRYDAAVSRIIHAPSRVFLIAGIPVLASLAVLPLLSWSPLPEFRERDVRITWAGAPGTSLSEMNRIMARASTELRQIPGVINVTAHVGRAVTGDQIVDVESGQLWVGIDSSADHDATLTAIRETVNGYPGLAGGVDTFMRNRMKPAMTGLGEPVVVRVHGPEPAVLRREADRVAQLLLQIDGVSNLRVEGQLEAPQVSLRVDLAAAGRVGLKPGDIRRAAATFFAGLEVGYLFEKQQVVELVVFGAPELRRSLTNIQELLIDTPQGGHVRLADVADVSVGPSPVVIEREGVSRTIDIRAAVAERDLDSVMRDVEKRLQTVEFPLEYHATILGDYAERQAAYWRMLIAALAAVTGAYFLLQACFQSWRMATAVFVTSLAALAGGVLAIVLTGGIVHLGSIAGMLAVLGVALGHGVALVRRYQLLELKEGELLGAGLVLRGAHERLGPMMRSVVAIAVALLPLLVMGDIAGLEIIHPLAVVVLGGLVTAAIVDLFVIPGLYLRFASPQAQPQIVWS